MLHARADYNRRIQDSEGLIPDDEPVFLLRGHDPHSLVALKMYLESVKAAGGNEHIVKACHKQLLRMSSWQATVRRKYPDMEEGDIV